MRYEIILSHVAVADLRRLKAHDRAESEGTVGDVADETW